MQVPSLAGRLHDLLPRRRRAAHPKGERLLHQAHALGPIGRFQLEAAIQSVHCARATTGVTDWDALRTLYVGLLHLAPSLGAQASLAAVVARVDGPLAGLAELDTLGEPAFQPFWAERAHFLAELGWPDAAARAYAKPIRLTTDPAVRSYLRASRRSATKKLE